jgi:hypothetical protein
MYASDPTFPDFITTKILSKNYMCNIFNLQIYSILTVNILFGTWYARLKLMHYSVFPLTDLTCIVPPTTLQALSLLQKHLIFLEV